MLKNNNDANKKQKFEANNSKSKDEAEERVVVEREKELEKLARVVTELAEKEAKEAAEKTAKEERKNKNAEIKGDRTHPTDVDIPRKYTTSTEAYTTGSGLGLGLWDPFQSTKC